MPPVKKEKETGGKRSRPSAKQKSFSFLGLELDCFEWTGGSKPETISEILARLKSTNSQFLDKNFPRTLPKKLGVCKWQTVSSIQKQKTSLHTQRTSVKMDMVEQGRLANCPSAVAILNISSQPDLLELIVPESQHPELGLNLMRIYSPEGTWELTPLDDFCVMGKNNRPLFMRLVRNNKVPLMAEKLLAKESGAGYLGLNAGGDTISPLYRCTGGSGWSKQIKITKAQDRRELYRDIHRHVLAGFFVNLGSGDEAMCAAVGVTKNHFLKFRRFEWITLFGYLTPVGIFSDPWGVVEFNGSLSPNKKSWDGLDKEGKKSVLEWQKQGLVYLELKEFTAFDVANYFYPRLPTCGSGVVKFDNRTWIVDSITREALGHTLIKKTFDVKEACLLIVSLLKLTGVAQVGFKIIQKRDASGRAVEQNRQFKGERIPHGYLEQGFFLQATPGVYEVHVHTPSQNTINKVRLRIFQRLGPQESICISNKDEQALVRYSKRVFQKEE